MKPAVALTFRAAVILAGLTGRLAEADYWGSPTTEFRSQNGQYILNIGWPNRTGLSLSKIVDSGKPERVWLRPFVDSASPPYAAYVANDGKHVVLRDVHGGLGYGKVLVFLDAQGEVLRSYELKELLNQDQILMKCAHSVSSIWWSKPGWFSLIDGDKRFAFGTHFGEIQCFDVATGNRIDLDEKGLASIREYAARELLPQLQDKSKRCVAAEMCGALKITAAIPLLKAWLTNTKLDSTQKSDGNFSSVQSTAAKALVELLGAEAAGLIEKQIPTAERYARKAMLESLAGIDRGEYEVRQIPESPSLLAMWHRLSQSKLGDVRAFARKEIVRRDQAQFVYDHPELIQDSDEDTRREAVKCLLYRGDARAIPLLRKAMTNEATAIWAFRGLIKYKPDDINDLLQQGLKSSDGWIRGEAVLELVRRGDKDATTKLINRIAELKNHNHDRDGEVLWVDDLCEPITEMKLSAAEPALRQAYTNKCERIRRPVSAALASLGDHDALLQLRQYAKSGEPLERAGSIRMLGLVGDTESIPTLHQALKDREPWIQAAAKEALERLEKLQREQKTALPKQ